MGKYSFRSDKSYRHSFTEDKRQAMKIGILGAGNIAATMADTIREMKKQGDDVELYAIGSRTQAKADRFAINTGCKKAYGSYEDLLKDPFIDLVYIATPHSEHYQNMLLCLKYEKPVLCEKAFTANVEQAQRILMMAELKGVPVTEAIWTRYMPMRKMIRDLLEEGVIGEVRTLTANLSYQIYDKHRIHQAELCGGALLDVGVYPMNFAEMVFGHPDRITATAFMSEDGVDESDSITYTDRDGRTAVLTCGTRAISDRQGIIYGDNGYMIVENINNPERIHVYNLMREEVRTIECPEQISGYEYEVRELMETIRSGKTECPSMPHRETLHMMKELDMIRSQIGYRFPFEK